MKDERQGLRDFLTSAHFSFSKLLEETRYTAFVSLATSNAKRLLAFNMILVPASSYREVGLGKES